MRTQIIEATNNELNWGKFLVGAFDDEEWARRSEIDTLSTRPLLALRGWGDRNAYRLVLDLETGEGAVFRIGGLASADLNQKHRIWVCPLFEPFLAWLYKQPDLNALPTVVQLPHAEFDTHGYRRQPDSVTVPSARLAEMQAELAMLRGAVAEIPK